MSKNKLDKGGFTICASHKSYSKSIGSKGLAVNYSAKSRFYALFLDILFLSLSARIGIVLLFLERIIGARFFFFTAVVAFIFMIFDLCKYLRARKFELENDIEDLSDLNF